MNKEQQYKEALQSMLAKCKKYGYTETAQIAEKALEPEFKPIDKCLYFVKQYNGSEANINWSNNFRVSDYLGIRELSQDEAEKLLPYIDFHQENPMLAQELVDSFAITNQSVLAQQAMDACESLTIVYDEEDLDSDLLKTAIRVGKKIKEQKQ